MDADSIRLARGCPRVGRRRSACGTRRHCVLLFPRALSAGAARALAEPTNYVLAFAYLIRGYNLLEETVPVLSYVTTPLARTLFKLFAPLAVPFWLARAQLSRGSSSLICAIEKSLDRESRLAPNNPRGQVGLSARKRADEIIDISTASDLRNARNGPARIRRYGYLHVY